MRAIFLNATWHQNEQMIREELYWICLQKWHISREMPQKVFCCARIQWSWVFLRNKSFHLSCLNLPVQLWECSLVWVLLSYLSNQSLILYLFKCSLPAHTILKTWWKAPSNGPTQLMWLFWRVFQLDGLFFLSCRKNKMCGQNRFCEINCAILPLLLLYILPAP